MTSEAHTVSIRPVPGLAEVRAGDDLAALVRRATSPADGDILVVTSKVVSKAEGRVVQTDRDTAVAAETDRVLARRGGTAIVRTRHGLVLAAAGVDASNTEPGTVVLLPVDPDASARRLREAIGSGGGPNVAVVVSDTLGRAWRNGQTDVAIGAAGLAVLHDLAGTPDGYGNRLSVTEPAIADEVASAADLVKGKLSRCPAAVLHGLGHLVTGRGEHGPGARALVREDRLDMFGHGAREAVLRALDEQPVDLRGFGAPAGVEDLQRALSRVSPRSQVHRLPEGSLDVLLEAGPDPAAQRRLGGEQARLTAAAFAMGWVRQGAVPPGDPATVGLRFAPGTP